MTINKMKRGWQIEYTEPNIHFTLLSKINFNARD